MTGLDGGIVLLAVHFVGKKRRHLRILNNHAGAGEGIWVFKGFLDWPDYVFRWL
jgi:hypothetical protein